MVKLSWDARLEILPWNSACRMRWFRQKLEDIFQMWTAYFERILSEAVVAGELPDIDTRTTAQAILAYYEGTLLLAKTYNQTEIVDLLAQRALQLARLSGQ